jgi:hypothetical protein
VFSQIGFRHPFPVQYHPQSVGWNPDPPPLFWTNIIHCSIKSGIDMKYFKLLICTVIMISATHISCVEEINCGTPGLQGFLYNEIVTDKWNAMFNASINFSNDPSQANCETYRNAYIDYIKALRDWQPCVNSNEQEGWEANIEVAEKEFANIQC